MAAAAHPGALLLALPWALAAMLLPALVRGRSLAVDIVVVSGWAAGLAAATRHDRGHSRLAGGPPDARGIVAGALLGALVALLAAGAEHRSGDGRPSVAWSPRAAPAAARTEHLR